MSLDKEKIKNVAKLARISVDDAKVDSLTKDLNSIFKFIEQLNELNTDKVEPLTSILNQSLRSRKDEISDGEIRQKILKNSPKENEEFFLLFFHHLFYPLLTLTVCLKSRIMVQLYQYLAHLIAL